MTLHPQQSFVGAISHAVTDLTFNLVSSLAKIGLVVNVLLMTVALMTWIERRLSGVMQFR